MKGRRASGRARGATEEPTTATAGAGPSTLGMIPPVLYGWWAAADTRRAAPAGLRPLATVFERAAVGLEYGTDNDDEPAAVIGDAVIAVRTSGGDVLELASRRRRANSQPHVRRSRARHRGHRDTRVDPLMAPLSYPYARNDCVLCGEVRRRRPAGRSAVRRFPGEGVVPPALHRPAPGDRLGPPRPLPRPVGRRGGRGRGRVQLRPLPRAFRVIRASSAPTSYVVSFTTSTAARAARAERHHRPTGTGSCRAIVVDRRLDGLVHAAVLQRPFPVEPTVIVYEPSSAEAGAGGVAVGRCVHGTTVATERCQRSPPIGGCGR